jgi:Family of unknown function (DUF6868)
MTMEQLLPFLGWCTVLNWSMLLIWAVMVMFAHDFTYKAQTMFFNISEDQFDQIHYKAMVQFKVLVFMFNFIPYLALRIIM